MKKLIAAAVIFAAPPSWAQVNMDKPLDVGGITQLVGDKIKEAKGATVFAASKKPAGALYLPVWAFHNAADTIDYVELGAGGIWRKNEKPAPIAVAAANFPGLSARAWSFPWAQQHLRRSPFPPIFFGPTLAVPLEYSSMSAMRWDHWRDYLGLVLSVRLGK